MKAAQSQAIDQENPGEQAPATEAQTSRPAAKFSGSGGLNVAVWKHRNEDGPDRYSVKLDRTYRDDAGEYHSTAYLRDSDLLRAGRVLDQADQWIEQDKAKFRGGNQEQSQSR